MTARRAPEWLTAWEYAHRGLHGDGVPENSLAAAEGAIAAGLGIECDIQMSADNVPMVFHDWALERLDRSETFARLDANQDWHVAPADHVVTRYEEKKLGDTPPIFLDFLRT